MGITPVIKDLGEKVAGDAIEGFGNFMRSETGAYGWVRSFKGLAEKSETGKALYDYIEKELTPDTAREAKNIFDAHISAGKSPAEALREASISAPNIVRRRAFGPHDELLIQGLDAIRKEKGVVYHNAYADALDTHFRDSNAYWRSAKILPGKQSLVERGLTSKPEYRTPKTINLPSGTLNLEQGIKNGFRWMYLPLVAIPHAAQSANIVLDNVNTPVKAIALGLKDYFDSYKELNKMFEAGNYIFNSKSKFITDLINSGALWDELKSNMQIDLKSQGKAGLFYKLFNMPAFNFVRRQEVTLAASMGKHVALEAADRLSENSNDKWAKVALSKIGLDFNKIAEQGFKLSNDDIQKAMYAMADREIYLRGTNTLQTPWKWQESFTARMTFMYRHYIYRQSAFLSRTFQDSYKEAGMPGLLKAIATFGLLFPVFGEFSTDMERLLHGKNPLDRDKSSEIFGNRIVDDIAHVGGFGIFYSILRSGMLNGGRGFLEGPFFTTVEDLTLGLGGDIYHGRYSQATQRVLNKLSVPGHIAAEALRDMP